MNIFVPLSLLLIVPLLTQEQENVASVRQVMNAWVGSFNENDPKKITSFYEKDERVDMFVSKGLSLRGFEDIATSYTQDMKTVRFYDSKSHKMKIRVFDKTALVSFIHRFKYEILGDGSHRQIHIRTTITLRETKDGWRIVQEHSSPIRGVERERIIGK